MKKYWVVFVLLCTACASVTSQSKREVTRVSWVLGAESRLDTLWQVSWANNVEKAVCLYGHLEDSVLVVDTALAPLRETGMPRQVRLQCLARPDFLGVAHTHLDRGNVMSIADRLRLGQMWMMVLVWGPH